MDFLTNGTNGMMWTFLHDDTPIHNLNDFLLYLPLVSPDLMAIIIEQISDVYVIDQEHINNMLSFLYRMIPETDAKIFADRVRYFFSEQHIGHTSDKDPLDPVVRLKNEEYEQYFSSENFKREFQAYCDARRACCNNLTNFAVYNRMTKRKI